MMKSRAVCTHTSSDAASLISQWVRSDQPETKRKQGVVHSDQPNRCGGAFLREGQQGLAQRFAAVWAGGQR